MKNSDVIIFGSDEYAQQLAMHLKDTWKSLTMYTMDEERLELLRSRGLNAELFDLSDNWVSLQRFDPEHLVAYCAICEEAKNIFLTISLRTTFPKMAIFALATDRQNAIKLKAAGANKTIVTAQIAANTITEMLEMPAASNMMKRLLEDTSGLQIVQVAISADSMIVGKQVQEVDFEKLYEVIVLAIINKDLESMFSFTKKGMNRRIEEGDVLVVLGYEESLKNFEVSVGERFKLEWHRWRW